MTLEVTRQQLEEYRSDKQEILELTYRIENRWKDEAMIGNDVVFDYSKGYPMPQSVVGFDQERYEHLQDRDVRRKDKLEKKCKETEDWVEEIEDGITRRIFRMYFLEGRKQKDVAKAVHIDQSRVSRKIEEYLKTHSTHKKHVYNNNRASRRKQAAR